MDFSTDDAPTKVPIPNALSDMSGLETLVLGGSFNGAITSNFGKLKALKKLNIGSATFSSAFPHLGLAWTN